MHQPPPLTEGVAFITASAMMPRRSLIAPSSFQPFQIRCVRIHFTSSTNKADPLPLSSSHSQCHRAAAISPPPSPLPPPAGAFMLPHPNPVSSSYRLGVLGSCFQHLTPHPPPPERPHHHQQTPPRILLLPPHRSSPPLPQHQPLQPLPRDSSHWHRRRCPLLLGKRLL